MTDADRAALVLPTQALHAWRLRFRLLGTGEEIRCQCRAPDAMLEPFGMPEERFLSDSA